MHFAWEDNRDNKKNRRRAPRIKIALPLSITAQDKILSSKTIDISRLGASCLIHEHLEEFSRVNAAIVFPFIENEKKVIIEAPVIIVNARIVPHNHKAYRIGFCFDDLTRPFQTRIKDLIKRLRRKIREEKMRITSNSHK